MSERQFDVFERELLADAVEGTYLIEFRDAVGDSGLSVDDYRRLAGDALMRLVADGLVDVSRGAWQAADTVPVGVDELRRRLDDGTAWDPDADQLLVIDASPAGRRAMSVPPA